MKSLATLIKLQKTRVDEQRQNLAKAQDFLDGVEKEIVRLEIRKISEQEAANANAEARMTYGAFLKVMVRDGRALEKQRIVAISAVEAARTRLAELFEEQKRYEIAAANRAADDDREERRRETRELDEIGSVTYTRKKI